MGGQGGQGGENEGETERDRERAKFIVWVGGGGSHWVKTALC